ncbi:MAG: hypothetical protein HIU89_14375 [Proteobacteria bacterium]|nr:hypothetical protein [Pseudomonadota bacterium]
MADVLSSVSAPAQRLYQVMCELAEDGICKANQRQYIAVLSCAFKTLIPARDELVRAGLVERIMHLRGKRDWYKIVPVTKIERTREHAERIERQQVRASAAIEEVRRQTSLFE